MYAAKTMTHAVAHIRYEEQDEEGLDKEEHVELVARLRRIALNHRRDGCEAAARVAPLRYRRSALCACIA